MGKKKLPLAFREHPLQRTNTFNARAHGMLRKAHELFILAGPTRILLTIETGDHRTPNWTFISDDVPPNEIGEILEDQTRLTIQHGNIFTPSDFDGRKLPTFNKIKLSRSYQSKRGRKSHLLEQPQGSTELQFALPPPLTKEAENMMTIALPKPSSGFLLPPPLPVVVKTKHVNMFNGRH